MDSEEEEEDLEREETTPPIVPTKPPCFPLLWNTTVNSIPRKRFPCIADSIGQGVGVVLENTTLFSSRVAKVPSGEFRFKAVSCALPLTSPNKISDQEEPCLGLINKCQTARQRYESRLEKSTQCLNEERKIELIEELKQLTKRVKAIDMTDNEEGTIRMPKNAPAIIKNNFTYISPLAYNWKLKPMHNVFNEAYMGGTLSSCQNSSFCEAPLVFRMSGKKRSKLVCSQMKISDIVETYETNDLLATSWSFPSEVFEIDSRTVSTQTLCCVRRENATSVLTCSAQPDSDLGFSLSEARIFTCKNRNFTSIKLSPFICSEVAFGYTGGVVKAFDFLTGQTVCKLKLDEKEGLPYDYTLARYGAHPRSLVTANGSLVTLNDTRMSNPHIQTLFSNDNHLLYPKEIITALESSVIDPFCHVIGATHSMVMVDDRYSKHPLMIWKHMLASAPLYLHYSRFQNGRALSNSVLSLASQSPSNIACFHLNHQQLQVKSFPLFHTSAPDMIPGVLTHRGNHLPYRSLKRFTAPLVGLYAVPLSHTNPQFRVLQQTSFGDVFYQDFTLAEDFDSGMKDSTFSSGVDVDFKRAIGAREADWVGKWAEKAAATETLFRRISSVKASVVDFNSLLEGLTDSADDPKHKGGCEICCRCPNHASDDIGDACSGCGLDTDTISYSTSRFFFPMTHSTSKDPLANWNGKLDFSNKTGWLSKRMLDVWREDDIEHNEDGMCSQDLSEFFSVITKPGSQPMTSTQSDQPVSHIAPEMSSMFTPPNSDDEYAANINFDLAGSSPVPKRNRIDAAPVNVDCVIDNSADLFGCDAFEFQSQEPVAFGFRSQESVNSVARNRRKLGRTFDGF